MRYSFLVYFSVLRRNGRTGFGPPWLLV